MSHVTKRVVLWVFYGGLGVLMLLIVTDLLHSLVPAFSSRIAYNSEGYLFAIALAGWIQFAIPRLSPSARLPWALGIGALWGLIGIALLLSDLPSRIRTLNETCMALLVLIPYVTLRRPLGRWVLLVPAALVVITAWAVVWAPESWVIDQAESFGFVVLAMLTCELFDRVLLDPSARPRNGLRWPWYLFMALEPVIVSALGTALREGDDPLALTLRYLGRIHESFIGVLLMALILHLVSDYRKHLTPASRHASP